MVMHIYEFLYRGRPLGGSQPSAYHVVLGVDKIDEFGKSSLVVSDPMTPAQAKKKGFDLKDIFSEINSVLTEDIERLTTEKQTLSDEKDALMAERTTLVTEKETLENDKARLESKKTELEVALSEAVEAVKVSSTSTDIVP